MSCSILLFYSGHQTGTNPIQIFCTLLKLNISHGRPAYIKIVLKMQTRLISCECAFARLELVGSPGARALPVILIKEYFLIWALLLPTPWASLPLCEFVCPNVCVRVLVCMCAWVQLGESVWWILCPCICVIVVLWEIVFVCGWVCVCSCMYVSLCVYIRLSI